MKKPYVTYPPSLHTNFPGVLGKERPPSVEPDRRRISSDSWVEPGQSRRERRLKKAAQDA